MYENNFFKNIISGTLLRVAKFLDPDQDQCSVCLDLGPNCLQWLSSDDKGRCQQGKIKETKSATMNIFRFFLFSFYIICKSSIKLCFQNKYVHYS